MVLHYSLEVLLQKKVALALKGIVAAERGKMGSFQSRVSGGEGSDLQTLGCKVERSVASFLRGNQEKGNPESRDSACAFRNWGSYLVFEDRLEVPSPNDIPMEEASS